MKYLSLLFPLAAIAQTTVVGTIKSPTGDLVSGSCSIRAVAAFTSGSGRVLQSPVIVKFTAGAFSARLLPNDTGDPSGIYYQVSCTIPSQQVGGRWIGPYSDTVPRQWVVPTSISPVDILAVEVAGTLNGPPLPKGDKGDRGVPGTAATITVGSVSTLSAGSPVTVTNDGTSGAAVLRFGIPQGAKGDKGDAATLDSPSIISALGYTPLSPDGAYSNPSWLAHLDWSRLLSVPNFAALYLASTALDTDANMAANSNARIPSQSAVVAYVAAHAGSGGSGGSGAGKTWADLSSITGITWSSLR